MRKFSYFFAVVEVEVVAAAVSTVTAVDERLRVVLDGEFLRWRRES